MTQSKQQKIISQNKKKKRLIKIDGTEIYTYKDTDFLIYTSEDKCFYDIRHVLNILSENKSSAAKKYTKYKQYIDATTMFKNKHGGYIVRDLVSEKMMYRIMFDFDGNLSKSFKRDTISALSQLHKGGKLSIHNDKLIYNGNSEEKMQYHRHNYANKEDVSKIFHRMSSAKIQITEYDQRHVIYCFILPIPNQSHDIIIKIGHTDNIVNCIKTFCSEYGHEKLFLIGIKCVSGESVVRKFNNLLKKNYPSLCYDPSRSEVNGKLYYASDVLLASFDSIEDC